MEISKLNAMREDDFIDALDEVYENGDWIAEIALGSRPFADFEQLTNCLRDALENSDQAAKTELLLSHPELHAVSDTNDPSLAFLAERKTAGLHQLDKEESELLDGLTEAYRGIHGFPFITHLPNQEKVAVFRSFGERLLNDRSTEILNAFTALHETAKHRVEVISA